MKTKTTFALIALMVILMLAACTAMPARTGEVHGKSGAPDATITLGGEQLPPPVSNVHIPQAAQPIKELLPIQVLDHDAMPFHPDPGILML